MPNDHRASIAEELLHVVTEANGIKDKNLIEYIQKSFDKTLTDAYLIEQIEELIKMHKLIAIEYSIDYTTVRNFLLPAKCSFIVRGTSEGTHRV